VLFSIDLAKLVTKVESDARKKFRMLGSGLGGN
jgi:hypothetical protein